MKKSTRRGSLFGKLIGSYVIFSMAAILLLIVAVLISFVFSYGNVLQENFPGITVGADTCSCRSNSLTIPMRGTMISG